VPALLSYPFLDTACASFFTFCVIPLHSNHLLTNSQQALPISAFTDFDTPAFSTAMNRMKSYAERCCNTILIMLPSALPILVLDILSVTKKPPIYWGTAACAVLRLCIIPVLLQERFRLRLSIITRFIFRLEPPEFVFGVFEMIRHCHSFLHSVFTWCNKTRSPENCQETEDKSNPDIVGSGVRLSMYILLFTVFVSLFIGSFHSGPSGTKELGIATLISTYKLL
jgi:hypothetical protein